MSTVDYDILIGNSRGGDVNLKTMDETRRNTWDYVFIDAILQQIKEGYKLILAPGTFSTRDRREKYMQGLAEKADVIGLYFMLPMRLTIDNIRTSRVDETHLVNYARVLDFYRGHNRAFPKEDHSDLLLPIDRTMLPPEFRVMLSKNEQNRNLYTSPQEDDLHHDRQWIVLTHRLKPQHLVLMLDEQIKDSIKMREYLYSLHQQDENQRRSVEKEI